jgi:hypothetical protein
MVTSRFRRLTSSAILVLAVTLIMPLTAASAASADGDPGLWYYSDFGVQQAHDEGFAGQGVKIAVLDSPLNPSIPMLSSADITVHEPSYCDSSGGSDATRLPATTTGPDATHGTNMVGYIAGNGTGAVTGSAQLGVAPKASILYYAKSFSAQEGTQEIQCPRNGRYEDDGTAAAEAIDQAVADGADIISMSFGTNKEESIIDAVARADKAGVIMVAAIDNYGLGTHGLDDMNGVVTVQSMDSSGKIPDSTTGADTGIDVVGPGGGVTGTASDFRSFSLGDGTSNATAIISGFLAVVKSKYPSASNNQIVQSLIHNTGVDDHELNYDPNGYFGYGVVSLQHMLREDPTQYPDVNPLISEDATAYPTYEQIFGVSPQASATPGAVEPASSGGAGVPGWIFVVGASILVLLVLLAIVLFIVLRGRRRPASENSISANNQTHIPHV